MTLNQLTKFKQAHFLLYCLVATPPTHIGASAPWLTALRESGQRAELVVMVNPHTCEKIFEPAFHFLYSPIKKRPRAAACSRVISKRFRYCFSTFKIG